MQILAFDLAILAFKALLLLGNPVLEKSVILGIRDFSLAALQVTKDMYY